MSDFSVTWVQCNQIISKCSIAAGRLREARTARKNAEKAGNRKDASHLRRDFHFTQYPEEAGHKQAERDLKFFLRYFLDRQLRAGKILLSASPTFDADRSGLI
jgi:hypothetical protein